VLKSPYLSLYYFEESCGLEGYCVDKILLFLRDDIIFIFLNSFGSI